MSYLSILSIHFDDVVQESEHLLPIDFHRVMITWVLLSHKFLQAEQETITFKCQTS